MTTYKPFNPPYSEFDLWLCLQPPQPGCAGDQRKLFIASANSYAHFSDPLDAAEHDLLGEALKIIQRYHSACDCANGCRLCEEADALLAKVKEEG